LEQKLIKKFNAGQRFDYTAINQTDLVGKGPFKESGGGGLDGGQYNGKQTKTGYNVRRYGGKKSGSEIDSRENRPSPRRVAEPLLGSYPAGPPPKQLGNQQQKKADQISTGMAHKMVRKTKW